MLRSSGADYVLVDLGEDRIVRSLGGFLLHAHGPEADLVRRLVAAPDHFLSAREWVGGGEVNRVVTIPGLIARGVVRVDVVDGVQGFRLVVPEPGDAGPAPDACPTCLELRVRQADVATAVADARQGSVMMRIASGVRPSRVIPVPGCPDCRPVFAGSLAADGQDVVLGTSWRTGDQAQMRARLEALIDPAVGVVAGVRRGSGLPADVPVWFAGANRALSTADPRALRDRLPGNAMGKGVTDEEARISALAEAVERWSGTWRPGDGTAATVSELRGEGWQVLDGVPAATLWVRASRLRDAQPVMVPAERVYLGCPAGPGQLADSNGLAAGTTLQDATLQGLFELVERDAITAWWRGKTRSSVVYAAADPALEPFERWLAGLGVRVDLRALDSLPGVHTILALGRSDLRDKVHYGAGTHVDSGIARRRAVLELVQLVAATLATPGEIAPWYGFDPGLCPDVDEPAGAVDLEEVRPVVTTVSDALDWTVGRLMADGIEPMVVDVTRPEIGVPVVRVLADGMRTMPEELR